MTLKWTTRRPPLRLYGSWDGDNIAELQGAFPDWTFEENQDGTLHVRSFWGDLDTDLPVGYWFTTDGTYEVDPTTTNEVQAAPDPGQSGLVSYDLTAD
jgi:hypothetical protein